jgi:endonuclease/exonuclease/phosphatase family metal-dependent hydrolase
MANNTLVIASLNLWGYNTWEERLPRIIEAIKEISPDIVFFQEVQKNPLFSHINQLDQINEQLKFQYSFFAEACIKTTHKGNLLPYPVNHGLGVLSKIP